MRTDLDHLPSQKQRELERVVQLVFEEFDDAFALAKHEWKKAGRILKVILYGSYARGTWVDEPHTAKGYVKARYSKHYRVTKEELEWLGAQVEELGRVVHEVCSERIEKLKAEAKAKPDRAR